MQVAWVCSLVREVRSHLLQVSLHATTKAALMLQEGPVQPHTQKKNLVMYDSVYVLTQLIT